MRKPGYPVELRLEDRAVLVVGGAAEAEQRVLRLLEAGARVTVFAPTVTEGLARQAAGGQVAWQARELEEEDLEGAFLVLLTWRGMPELGAALREKCREKHVLLWAHDAPELCDVTMPALIESGPVRLAISTGGRNSALARAVKAALQSLFDARFAVRATAALDSHRPPTLRFEGRWRWD